MEAEGVDLSWGLEKAERTWGIDINLGWWARNE